VSRTQEPHLHLEVGHILFLDIVGYSKLLSDEQKELVQELNRIVRETEQFRAAEAEGKLTRLPTGDGMVLVFTNNPEAPVECALEISKALQSHPKLKVRMGIHSGPVNPVTDVNDQSNLLGAGINVAQRVMSCGDAGHILLSKNFAEHLEHYAYWRSHLHDLGEVEVKHGVRVPVVNLYTDQLGNAALPTKLRRARAAFRLKSAAIAALLLIAGLSVGFWMLRRSQEKPINAATAIPSKSIAVLPFENLSEEKASAFFTNGVQDEILSDLAKVADLKVISRTSVMLYKAGNARNLREIGEQLGVAHVLEGSVQRAGNKVRVNAQLVDTRTDTHLWAQSYDRDLTDVFAIQSEIAETIARQLQARLSPSEKAAIEKPSAKDFFAFDLYTQASGLLADLTDPAASKERLPRGIALLKEAVTRDPHFVSAWCLLSQAHARMYSAGYDRRAERLEESHAAIEAALRYEPEAGEVHLALANYYYDSLRDYERARSELSIAQRKLPNSAQVAEELGYIERREGDWKEATRNLERAANLDPRNVHVLQQLALTYQALRRYPEQARIYERVLTLTPGNRPTRALQAQVAADWKADIRPFQALMAELTADGPEAAAEADDINYDLCERTPEAFARGLKNYPSGGSVNAGVNYPHAYWEGLVARCQGEEQRARVAFEAARSEIAALVQANANFAAAVSLLGMIDAGLGRKEEAMREGRYACELLPLSKDALDGTVLAINLAQIYVWTGERDLAIAQIVAVQAVPNYLSYGLLKLQPIWDPLRGDPRFEKLLASLAPKRVTGGNMQ